jgi:hypothetical protein
MMSLTPEASSLTLMKISVLIVPRMSNNRREKAMVNRPRKQGRKQQGSARRSAVTDPALFLRPEFRNQPVATLKIPATPVTVQVTGGVLSTSVAINNALISLFSTRFSAWDEYRIIKAKVSFKNFNSTLPGIIVAWFDEVASAPVLSESRTNAGIRFNASDISKDHVMVYTPHDPREQVFTQIGTSFVPQYLKFYSDNLNYGLQLTTGSIAMATIDLTIQFRGYA